MALGNWRRTQKPRISNADQAASDAVKDIRYLLRPRARSAHQKPYLSVEELRTSRCSPESKRFVEAALAADDCNPHVARWQYSDVIWLLSGEIGRSPITGKTPVQTAYECTMDDTMSAYRMATAVGFFDEFDRDQHHHRTRAPEFSIDDLLNSDDPKAVLALALLGRCTWQTADRITRAGFLIRKIVDDWRSRG